MGIGLKIKVANQSATKLGAKIGEHGAARASGRRKLAVRHMPQQQSRVMDIANRPQGRAFVR